MKKRSEKATAISEMALIQEVFRFRGRMEAGRLGEVILEQYKGAEPISVK